MNESTLSNNGHAVLEKTQLQYNERVWGSCELQKVFKNKPYQSFSNSDHLGKMVDKKYSNKYASVFDTGVQYTYHHDEDESTLRGHGMRGGLQEDMQSLGKSVKAHDQRRSNTRKYVNRGPPPKIHDASVTVRPDWSTMEEMDFPRLAKLSLPNVKEGEDIIKCGALEYYDKTYDRVSVKNEKPLQKTDRIFHTVTTIDDPIIRRLSKTVGNVFATDAILATIMCCTRSNYSWDIVIEKIGDKLFMDKRDNTEFDLLTVNETSVEPPQDDSNSLNSPRNLAIEATFINHNFSQQVLKGDKEKYKFEESNPFIGDDEEGEVASVAYRYRKWDLNNGITLVARCEHDAALQTSNNDVQFLTIKALNEWDSKMANGIEWRQKLDTQLAAVLANELRNNACKLAKWTVQAVLAGSDKIKFGYVSRAHVRDSSRHVILGTQQFKPLEFATQINLSMDNAWGILRCIIDLCMKEKDGKYLIMKDPNKQIIRLYDIPDNIETDDSEESGDEGETFQQVYSSDINESFLTEPLKFDNKPVIKTEQNVSLNIIEEHTNLTQSASPTIFADYSEIALPIEPPKFATPEDLQNYIKYCYTFNPIFPTINERFTIVCKLCDQKFYVLEYKEHKCNGIENINDCNKKNLQKSKYLSLPFNRTFESFEKPINENRKMLKEDMKINFEPIKTDYNDFDSLKDNTSNDCQVCDRKFVHKSELERHMKKHAVDLISETGNSSNTKSLSILLKCRYCGRVYKGINDQDSFLDNNTKYRNNILSNYILQASNFDMFDTSRIENPLKCSVVSGLLQCEFCESQYTSLADMMAHQSMHDLKYGFNCLACEKCVSTTKEIFMHRTSECQYHNAAKNSDKENHFVCNICKEKFTSLEKLYTHRYSLNHLNPRRGLGKGLQTNRGYCSDIHDSAKEANQHQEEKHNKKMKKETTKQRQYLCDVCGKSYTQSSHLWQHLRFHRGVKPFQCDVPGCERKFTIRPDLNDHIRKCHTHERPFHCTTCNKKFLTGSVYYQHRLIHRGERRYGCDVCSKRFYRADALKNHIRIHTGEKPFPCQYCEKKFRQRGDRDKHVRARHPVKLAESKVAAITKPSVPNKSRPSKENIEPDVKFIGNMDIDAI